MFSQKKSESKNELQSDQESEKLFQYIAALCVCLGSLAAGGVLGWTGNISDELLSTPFNGIKITKDDLEWISSLATLGAVPACLVIGKLCDVLGRKTAMLLLTVPFMIGWLLIILPQSLIALYIGRFLTGFSGCAFCVSIPIYVSEIAEKEIRGALGNYFELLLTIGILFAYTVPIITDPYYCTIIMASLPLVFFVAFLFQPESPVFNIKRNKEDEARKALRYLRGKKHDVDAEIRDIKQSLLDEAADKQTFIESLKTRSTKKAILICFSIMFFQQAGGINAVVFYAGIIFHSTGSSLDPKLSTIIIGVMQAVATFVSSLIVDKVGRRFLLITSLLIVAISGVVLGIYFTLQIHNIVDNSTLKDLNFIPLLSLSIFIILFSIGVGPIPWMLSAELSPPEIKSLLMGTAASFNWFIAFLITKFYFSLESALGSDVTFYVFSAVSFSGAVFIYFVVPETKGKSLEEIQKELNGKDAG